MLGVYYEHALGYLELTALDREPRAPGTSQGHRGVIALLAARGFKLKRVSK